MVGLSATVLSPAVFHKDAPLRLFIQSPVRGTHGAILWVWQCGVNGLCILRILTTFSVEKYQACSSWMLSVRQYLGLGSCLGPLIEWYFTQLQVSDYWVYALRQHKVLFLVSPTPLECVNLKSSTYTCPRYPDTTTHKPRRKPVYTAIHVQAVEHRPALLC